MRIGIEASSMLATHLTGIEYSLTEVVKNLAKVDSRNEYVLHFNFTRAEYQARFEARVVPLLSERVKAQVCRVPGLVMLAARRHLGWPIDASLGPCALVYYHALDMRPQWSGARVLTIHDLMPITHPDLFPKIDADYFGRHVPRMAHKADALIAVSQYTKDVIVERLGIAPDKISVVHPGVDRRFRPPPPDSVDELKTRLGLHRPYVVYVGTAEPRKNLPRLVEAVARLRRQGHLELQLVIAGKSAWGSAALRECIDACGMKEHVRLLGYLPEADLPPLYAGAQAASLPSLAEGFGLPLIEAMACGVPIVASNATALPEVYGDAAVGVDPHDIDAMAHALGRVMTDPELRSHLIDRGVRRASAFSWEATARRTVAVFDRTAG
jgi:glycosyltransferase involved in cell wall biosynthesis